MTDSATKTEAIQNQNVRFRNQNVWFRNPNLRFRNQNVAATPSDHIWPLCCMLNFTKIKPPPPSVRYVASWTLQEIKTLPPPLTTKLHLELHKRPKPRPPLWPLCCTLNFTRASRDLNPATPSDHYSAPWTSQEIKTPPPPLTAMLHVELHKRSKPRHPLWPLCRILDFTRDQNPAAPSDYYSAPWTSQEIKTPPPPLTTMLHLELHKRSKPRHPLWLLCCILNFARDQNPAFDHYVACFGFLSRLLGFRRILFGFRRRPFGFRIIIGFRRIDFLVSE